MFHGSHAQNSTESGNAVTISDFIDWTRLTARQHSLVTRALRALAESGRAPSARELRAVVGSGSMRDHNLAVQSVAKAVDCFMARDAVRDRSATELELQRLSLQLSDAHAAVVAKDAEFDGLRKHLLLETARIRDELKQDRLHATPVPSVAQPGYDEPIYAGRVDRSWK
ncbi:MAG: hypothetical protein EAZ30_02665 [Betaproteobacteria bacterium]|nr:MAG: hypothetical protein EAZ30_02665 [Betaproteobacteria bacterium]